MFVKSVLCQKINTKWSFDIKLVAKYNFAFYYLQNKWLIETFELVLAVLRRSVFKVAFSIEVLGKKYF